MNDKDTFDSFFRPRSVAVVGASPQRGSARNTIMRVLLKHGFAGRVYPVSPSHPEIEGLKAYASIEALPEAPDVALVITPAHTVPDIIAECGAKGIRNAIVYSSGFEEIESGKALARRLAEAAAQHNVAVLGPNCQGVWSIRQRSMLTFSSGPLNLEKLQQAPIAVISQSGALAGAIGAYLQGSGIGCSYIVSVGNETCLDALDFLDWTIEQDDVRVVALYIEGLHVANRILRIAERARERGVQIVVLKAGRSAVGQQATASHTGKIASSHAVYSDVLEQAGVIAINSLAEALAAVEVLAFLPNPRPGDDPKAGISVLSSSGGAGALLADHSSEFNIPMSEFSPETAERLEQFLPAFARKANPVDLTGQIYSDPNLFSNTCRALASDPRTEAIVVQFASSGGRNLQENADVFKSVARDLPVIASFVGTTVERQTSQALREAGVLLCGDPAATMNALSLLYTRRRMSALPKAQERKPLPARTAPRDWAEIMSFCEESGVTPARWLVLGPEDSAAKACTGMRYPLVVKVLPSESEHKTELGLVKLRVRSAEEVDAHAADFRRRLGKPAMEVLVQEMVDEGVEVVLSCLRKTDFGPVISIGTGGVAIELYRDVTHLALPVSAEHVLTALRRLKLWTLLQGFRGKPAADADALVRAAVRFGDLFLATKNISEFEINPVIVRPQGQRFERSGRAGHDHTGVDVMHAVQVRKPGPPDSHFVEEVPGLDPGSGQVLVDVKAAPVNYPDLLVMSGRYQNIPPMPFAPGMDAAGVVRSIGAGVTRVKCGDRVLIHVAYGAYATQAIARQDLCMPLPQEMDFVDAVALGLASQTAWFALVERGGYRPGDVVLVNGATGAVGHAAAQIAAALGATVLAGASSLARGKALLKDVPCQIVDLGAQDLRKSLRDQVYAATAGKGADIVIDTLGGDVFDASLRALAWGGRLVTVGFAAGRIPEVKANYLLVKNISATGLQWTDFRDREPWKVAHAHSVLAALWERGALRPHVMQTLPLRDFADAFRLIETRGATGRLVLTMN